MQMQGPNAPIIAQNEAAPVTGAPSMSVPLILAAGILIPAVLAYGFAVGSELQVLAGVCGVLGVLFILARPFAGLVLLLGLLYIRPEESIPALAGLRFTLLVAVVTLIGMLVQMLLEKQRIVRTPMNWMILGLLGAISLSSVIANADTVKAISETGKLVAVVLLVLNLTRSPKRYESLVTSLLVFTGYVAVYSIYLFHTGTVKMDEGLARSEATGLFSDPNDLATIFVAGIALCIMRIIQTRGGIRVAYISIISVLLYATVITNSRSGFMALVAVVGAYVICSKMTVSKKIAIGVMAAILLLGITGARMRNYDSDDESANQRFWYWSNAVSEFRAHPLTGDGPGNFPDANGGMTAHNSFALCFAELGILGYFFWIGCLYISLRRLPRDKSHVEMEPNDAQNLFAARMSVTGYMVASFWLSHTYNPILYILMCLPLAAQCKGIALRPGGSPAPLTWKMAAKILLLCVISIIFIWWLAENNK